MDVLTLLPDNYDSTITMDDGSCIYIGCTDIFASNFCMSCNFSDSSLCTYYPCNLLGYTEDFESNSLSLSGWTSISASESSVSLTNTSAISDTVSLQFEGLTANYWTNYLTESEAYANSEHIASSSFCMDLSNSGIGDSIMLTFETEMFSTISTRVFMVKS